MSRVGKRPIEVPANVKVAVTDALVRVEGPKGTLETRLPAGVSVRLEDGKLLAERVSDSKPAKSLHGLVRTLVSNTVIGVTDGFQKDLDVVGIGYRAEVRGKYLNLSLGFSHPIEFPIPDGISIKVERLPRTISNYVATVSINGIDKYRVGQVAADIRSLRPPDPYKGKGIRYTDEAIKLKVGKKGA